MLDFSRNDEKAQLVAIHYAKQFNDLVSLDIIQNNRSIKDKEDALHLSRFYWKMVDASIEDRDNKVEVLGEMELEYWMEKLLNIIGGYLGKIGYAEEWDKAVDEA